MTWLPILLVALGAFAVAAFVLRLPRGAWALFGAALLVGLAGYALQGNPGLAGAPKPPLENISQSGEAMVEARRALFDPDFAPSSFVTIADGFTRRGQFEDAAGLLRGAVEQDPSDTEAWLALGNVLIEHAAGAPTPAALYAYSRAEESDPNHPGAAYFTGLALIRAGQPGQARAVWSQAIENAPEDMPWLPAFRERLDVLDRMLADGTPR